MVKRKNHGPGFWLCWECAMHITNSVEFKSRWWIALPEGYRSKGGKCADCGRVVYPGERAAKVTEDAAVLFTRGAAQV